MKANEAPEKFYLLPNGFISYFRNTDEDIEYTRTDAVKGAKWQEEHLIGKIEQFLYEELSNGDIECHDMKSLIEYFKSYMKEDKL